MAAKASWFNTKILHLRFFIFLKAASTCRINVTITQTCCCCIVKRFSIFCAVLRLKFNRHYLFFLQKIKSPSGDYCCKCGRIHKNHQTNGLVRAPKERCGGFTKYLAALSFTSRWRHRSVISKATESQFELAV